MVAWAAVAGALSATAVLLNVVKRKRAKDLYKVPVAGKHLPLVGRVSMLSVRCALRTVACASEHLPGL